MFVMMSMPRWTKYSAIFLWQLVSISRRVDRSYSRISLLSALSRMRLSWLSWITPLHAYLQISYSSVSIVSSFLSFSSHMLSRVSMALWCC